MTSASLFGKNRYEQSHGCIRIGVAECFPGGAVLMRRAFPTAHNCQRSAICHRRCSPAPTHRADPRIRPSRKINSLFSVLRERLTLLPGLPSARPHPACKDVGMLLESNYIQPSKPLPPIPVRVSRRSQLTAALRQHARSIVIEDQGLARPFARLLRARELRLWAVGEFVADTMSHAYGANIEAHWQVGRYVPPGNVQKVILKPKPTAPDDYRDICKHDHQAPQTFGAQGAN